MLSSTTAIKVNTRTQTVRAERPILFLNGTMGLCSLVGPWKAKFTGRRTSLDLSPRRPFFALSFLVFSSRDGFATAQIRGSLGERASIVGCNETEDERWSRAMHGVACCETIFLRGSRYACARENQPVTYRQLS
jgi:hypothetical protein